jgi:tRNA(adenine34) deaminase
VERLVSSEQSVAAALDVALDEAALAARHDDVPVGAVVLRGERIIARRHNERELRGDPTAHAEMLAIRDAADDLGRWRLEDCTLVVTLEPCPMCAGAAWAARLGKVVYAAADFKAGAMGSLYNVAADNRLNHQSEVVAGPRSDESARMLRDFFESHRGTSVAE